MDIESSSPAHRSTLGFLSVTAAAILALAACSPDEEITSEQDDNQVEDTPSPETEEETQEASETPDQEPSEDETTEDTTTEEPSASGEHPVYQALEAALAEYPDGVITEFEQEGSYIEVHVYDGSTEWEVQIDASTFEVLDTRDDGIDADDEQEAQAVEIDIVEALQAAEGESGAEPYEGSLDTELDTVVWEFEMDNGMDVYVDVTTGEVVGTDQ